MPTVCNHVNYVDGCEHCAVLRRIAQQTESKLTLSTHAPTPVIRQRLNLLSIPKKIHRVWVGPKPIPENFQRYWETWVYFHPGWEWRTWREADIPALGPQCERLCAECRNPAEVSDVMRFYIVAREGGVYVDTDFEAFRNIEPALYGADFVAAWEGGDLVASAFFAAVPGQAHLAKFCAQLDGMKIDTRLNQIHTAGPRAFTKAINIEAPGTIIHPTRLFYPIPYGTVGANANEHPDAFAAHHWAHTWQSDWNTITYRIETDGEPAAEATLASITPRGPNDVIATRVQPIRTTHVVRLNNGDRFAPEAVARVKKILRHAANYAANDFLFRDDGGEVVRVEASLDQGNPAVRIEGPPILLRAAKQRE